MDVGWCDYNFGWFEFRVDFPGLGFDFELLIWWFDLFILVSCGVYLFECVSAFDVCVVYGVSCVVSIALLCVLRVFWGLGWLCSGLVCLSVCRLVCLWLCLLKFVVDGDFGLCVCLGCWFAADLC